MTEKKGYEPQDANEDSMKQPAPESTKGGQQPEIIIMIVRNAAGKLEMVQHLEKTDGITEAWTVKNLVEDAVNQFVDFVRYKQAKERQALRTPPSFMQGLRNGLKKK